MMVQNYGNFCVEPHNLGMITRGVYVIVCIPMQSVSQQQQMLRDESTPEKNKEETIRGDKYCLYPSTIQIMRSSPPSQSRLEEKEEGGTCEEEWRLVMWSL